MAVMETIKAVVDIVRKLNNVDLINMVIHLQSQVRGLLDENKTLKDDNESLRAKLAVHKSLVFHDDAYWTKDGEGPFCSRCWDEKKTGVRMHQGATEGTFVCPSCGASMWTEEFRNRKW